MILNLEGYSFRFVDFIKPDRDQEGRLVELMPQARYKNRRGVALHQYGAGPFCRFRVLATSREGGVYAITSSDELMYVGRGSNLSERFGSRGYGSIQPRNCFQGGQSTNCKVNSLILQHSRRGRDLQLWFHSTGVPAPLESELIRRFRPPWNDQVP